MAENALARSRARAVGAHPRARRGARGRDAARRDRAAGGALGAEGWRRYADALQERAVGDLRRERRGRSLRAPRQGERGEARRHAARGEGLRRRRRADGRRSGGASRARPAPRARSATRGRSPTCSSGASPSRPTRTSRRTCCTASRCSRSTSSARSAQGLATLRQALERVPDHAASREALEGLLDDDALFDDAFEALEFVHRTLGRSEELAKLYERRVARAQSTRDESRARLDLARVLEEMVGDRARAQRAVEAAVAEDPSDEDALAELERLAGVNDGWARGRRDPRGGARGRRRSACGDAHGALWVRLAAVAAGQAPRQPSRRGGVRAGRSRSTPRTSTSCGRSRTSGARRAASGSSCTRCARARGSRPTSRPSASSCARRRRSRRGPSATATSPRPRCAISSPRTRRTSGRSRS